MLHIDSDKRKVNLSVYLCRYQQEKLFYLFPSFLENDVLIYTYQVECAVAGQDVGLGLRQHISDSDHWAMFVLFFFYYSTIYNCITLNDLYRLV